MIRPIRRAQAVPLVDPHASPDLSGLLAVIGGLLGLGWLFWGAVA